MRRRPPFALVLIVFVAALAGAIALTSGGGGGRASSNPDVPATGPVRTCVAAHAEAAAVAARTLRAPVTARIPITVTERGGGASVTVSEAVVEHAVATRVLEVRRRAVARRRACATGAGLAAARSRALTRAYKSALAVARVRAKAGASAAVQAFAARELPSLIASGQREADARAQVAAASDRRTLAAQARARLP